MLQKVKTKQCKEKMVKMKRFSRKMTFGNKKENKRKKKHGIKKENKNDTEKKERESKKTQKMGK